MSRRAASGPPAGAGTPGPRRPRAGHTWALSPGVGVPRRRATSPGPSTSCPGAAPRRQAPDAARRHRLRQDLHDGNVIAQLNRPTLVIAPNKTLAAQLYGEFKELFPDNAVEYFVSYYDYYQPEAYVPTTDTYIEKDASINDEIDSCATRRRTALLTRRDVIIVASVSCIYGLGSPEKYGAMLVYVEQGQTHRARRAAAPAGRHPVRAQRLRLPPRHVPRARRRGRDLPAYEESARSASSSSATRSSASPRSTRCAARCCARPKRAPIYPGQPLRHDRASELKRAIEAHPRRAAASACRAASATASCSRRSGSSSARSTISRCSSRWASAPASRTTRATSTAARRAAAVHAARLLPDDFLLVHRREPRHRAADRRHVPRRPLAQGDAGRATASGCRRRSTTGR